MILESLNIDNLAHELKARRDQKLTEYFNNSGPSESRTDRSVRSRVHDMETAFKFISAFNNGKIPGSTGRPDWFELSSKERSEIAKGKVNISYSYFLILVPYE